MAQLSVAEQMRLIADTEILVRIEHHRARVRACARCKFSSSPVSPCLHGRAPWLLRVFMQIAMHGAALSYAMFMRAHGAVIELWPRPDGLWRCFEHLATHAGVEYERWGNSQPSRYREDRAGDYLTVDGAAVAQVLQRVVAHVRDRRAGLPVVPANA